jgi:hypothetical protein
MRDNGISIWGLIVAGSLFLAGQIQGNSPLPEKQTHWFKGNLHSHTTRSDGDSSPEQVISWYRDQGYDFLAITDHNLIVSPDEYQELCPPGFLLISANEISDRLGKTPCHLLALNVVDPKLAPAGGATMPDMLQNNIRAIRAAGGVPVLAHPNFKWAFQAEEILQLSDCKLFEVWNAHPRVNNLGGGGWPSTEETWDRVLSTGRRIFGIGTDDMHLLATYPGKAWVVVKAEELSAAALLAALEAGEFYASTGVDLEDYRVEPDRIRIRIRVAGVSRYRTQFIGRHGKLLKNDESSTPTYSFTGTELYVRARVVDSNGLTAWTQPYFLKKPEIP